MKKLYAFWVRCLTILLYPLTAAILHNSRRVRVLVIAGDKALLQRTSVGSQHWSIPGGGVKKNEDDKSAAVREIAEEVGIHITADQLKLLGEDYRPENTRHRWPTFTRVYFVARLSQPVAPKIERPLEILEARWFSLDDLPRYENKTIQTALTLLKNSSS